MVDWKEPTCLHPSTEQLAAFARDGLSEDGIVEVEAHLAECDRCCEAIATLPADDFLSRLRTIYAGATPQPSDIALCQSGLGQPTVIQNSTPAEWRPSTTPDLPELPGFEDWRELGRGGMGVVYAARHAVMGRRVAVKLIHAEYNRHPAAVERFRREVRAAARLAHPNLVTAYDAGQDGDRPFLVMELIDGETLAERLRRDGPLPVHEACGYIRQAALGLQHAHDNGLIHRDVKPHNLMLAAGTVKVLDFGLAALTDDSGRTGHTGPNAVMGTPDYMAPEQAEDARRADGRADVYSLGCTLFHLLTGTVPFQEDSTLLKLLAHRTHERPSARSARHDVPSQLDAVLRKAMARQPEERHQTPGALAEALEPFTDPAHAARENRQRRYRMLLALAAFVTLTAVAAAGVTKAARASSMR
jgi:serine/threonine protein kinase